TGVINNGDVAFMVIATVLVYLMIPGLAFFYGGLVARKNSLTMMMYTFLTIGIVTVLWVLGGFSLVFGSDIGGVIGNPVDYMLLHGVDFSVNPNYGSKIPFLMFFMYQLMFAIITPPLMTGAFASRVNILGWLRIMIPWIILIYFPVAHWVWGGGFLHKIGFVDYAGGTVIHVSAAFGALAAILYLGKRAVIPKRNFGNINMMLIGAAFLLFGWFGFNSGGALAGGQEAAIAFTNTGIAAGLAMITWIIIDYQRKKRFSIIELITGAVAGLATITPCAGYVLPESATLIGIIGAVVCYFSLMFVRKMGWDDALGVWGVHGMGGFSGTLMIGIFAIGRVNEVSGGVHQFFIQLFGAALVALYAFIMTSVIIRVANAISSVKVSEEVQKTGLDNQFMEESVE
ncbi:MAG: ammonium transporter, partial [Bacteroidales bacterium]